MVSPSTVARSYATFMRVGFTRVILYPVALHIQPMVLRNRPPWYASCLWRSLVCCLFIVCYSNGGFVLLRFRQGRCWHPILQGSPQPGQVIAIFTRQTLIDMSYAP